MAVYARGYRPYEGSFRHPPVALSIFGEGLRMALARKGVRRILILIAVLFCVMAGILYFQFGMQEQLAGRMGPVRLDFDPVKSLNRLLRSFHRIAVVLVSLASVLVGAGLVADDLRSRALSLYLVRPVRPFDYVLGKSLILPGLLVPLALLPGLLLWFLVGLWQPPGETWSFLADNVDIAVRTLHFYVVGALSLTGLMLLLSSRTPRRGVVMGLAAAVLFGGLFVRWVGRAVGGEVGSLLRSFDLMANMRHPLDMAGSRNPAWRARWEPDPDLIWVVAVVLLVAGLVLTWRRARTVEVSE